MIISFYKDKSGDLKKLLKQIGGMLSKARDRNNQAKWVSSIIEKYVDLLLCTAITIEEMKKLNSIKHFFALKIEKFVEKNKETAAQISSLEAKIEECKAETENVREEERKAQVKLMQKSAEFTVRMDELLNIKEEKDKAFQMAKTAEKKLKESKKTYKKNVSALVSENTELLYERNELQDIVEELEFKMRMCLG